MRIRLKHHTLRMVTLAFLVAAVALMTSSRAICRPKDQGVVQIPKFDFSMADDNDVIGKLSAAVRSNPTARKIRISWDFAGPMHNYYGTILYDRTAQTVKIFACDSLYARVQTWDYLYDRISDDRIHKLAENVRDGKVNRDFPGQFYLDNFLIEGTRKSGYVETKDLE